MAPLLIVLAASRISAMRKLTITAILFIGGYTYIMIRKATQHTGDRVKKREFLDRVAPRGASGGMPYKSSMSSTSSPQNGYRSNGYSPSPSPMSRQYSDGPAGMPPMVRAPSAPLEFNKAPNKKQIKLSRNYSTQN